jgi:hypothetical protein
MSSSAIVVCGKLPAAARSNLNRTSPDPLVENLVRQAGFADGELLVSGVAVGDIRLTVVAIPHDVELRHGPFGVRDLKAAIRANRPDCVFID